ncbi:MAG: PSD1 and planctomycete cytochrome C domain-containing protein [Planctomycetaceae bacterium]
MMRQRGLLRSLVTGAAVLFSAAAMAADAPRTLDFNRDIRPILARNCFACHGQDDTHREGGLRLDIREDATRKLESGATAIVPGDPKTSEILRRVTATNADEKMPPADSGLSLTPDQIEQVTRWIQQGANYAKHWSFTPPVRPAYPALENTAWPVNGIDHFVLARLEAAGLGPSPEADRYALARRLSLDLRGLPPTIAETDEFVNDKEPDAYERFVDRMLDDTAYGERWARIWLDLARYADSKGYGSDPLRSIWQYRDWVIEAFNRNMPFDQFTIEQLAGDLLPEPTREKLVATAFHRNTMTNTEGGTDDEEYRVAAVKDRVDSTMQIWMGLTMGCAKCHTHKYDPITQKEYYQFYGYFNQTADNDLPDEAPTIDLPTPEIEEQLHVIEHQISDLKKQMALMTTKKPIEDEIAKLEKSKPEIPKLPIFRELPADKRRITRIMDKGNFLTPGDEVTAAIPAAFHRFPEGAPQNRLGVAKWLLSRENPLTARVTVNRFWAQLFGAGIVETEEDFGTQGELPSHPELLDWLSVEFMDSGWDVKELLKRIVTSHTYRQSVRVTPELLAKDPRNRLYSRGPRFRLEAELVRDQALALSGLLSRKLNGPSVFPPQPPGLWQAAFNGKDRNWATSSGEDRYRRGLYTFWRRTVPYPSMTTFDAPSREICTVRRFRTNTPLQAFVTLNDPVYVEAAQALARRIVRDGGTTVEERVRFAIRLCLGRPADDKQAAALAELYRSEIEHYRKNAEPALKIATDPLGPVPEGMDAAELAAWTIVANVLLNLDGVLMKG